MDPYDIFDFEDDDEDDELERLREIYWFCIGDEENEEDDREFTI